MPNQNRTTTKSSLNATSSLQRLAAEINLLRLENAFLERVARGLSGRRRAR
jgi:hypothetical protein